MLHNRELQIITQIERYSENMKSNIEEKYERKKLKLNEYLKQRKKENNLSSIDIILLKYLKGEFVEELNSEEDKQ